MAYFLTQEALHILVHFKFLRVQEPQVHAGFGVILYLVYTAGINSFIESFRTGTSIFDMKTLEDLNIYCFLRLRKTHYTFSVMFVRFLISPMEKVINQPTSFYPKQNNVLCLQLENLISIKCQLIYLTSLFLKYIL